MITEEQKLISIIIAAYNTERYISQAIESALEQTYRNIEIVIIDDGSTDGTLKIAEEYAAKDDRIVICSQSNKGVSAARNAGFAKATGDYFCIVDADDIILPEKVACQVDFMTNNLSVDFIYSKVYYFMDQTHDIYRHDLATVSGPRVYEKLLQYGNFIYTSTVFFRRSVFDTFGGFDEQLRSAEEFDYWLRLAGQGVVFHHQDRYLTLCRSRDNGLTSDNVTMYATAAAVFEKHNTTSNYQYWKNKLLLRVAKARKPALVQGGSMSPDNAMTVGYWIRNIYGLFKKMKFFMTFKKIHDTTLEKYLIKMESHHGL